LGEQFDIHTGGEDHLPIHHPNEIAQSEGATGKSPFVKYWLHYTFLVVDGKKMSKSLGNYYTVEDVINKGYDPIALRYLYLTAHYRDPLNFTWDSLSAAQNGLERLRSQVISYKSEVERTALSLEKEGKIAKYREDFLGAVNDDLNTPQALAVLWEMMKSNIPAGDKYDLALAFDEILGLGLSQVSSIKYQVSKEVQKLIDEREELRKAGKFDEADEVRSKIEDLGYKIKDTDEGSKVTK